MVSQVFQNIQSTLWLMSLFHVFIFDAIHVQKKKKTQITYEIFLSRSNTIKVQESLPAAFE